MRKSLLTVLLFSFIIYADANAQRLIERGMTLNPLNHPGVDVAEGEVEWFPQVGGWASFGNYGLYSDDDHTWYQHLGAYVEIYRRGNESSLALTSQIEFVANSDNDINFSPRAIFWEEGLLYTRSAGRSYWQLGYYHRCKHDIDNLRFGEERTMVFGSVLARIITPLSLRNEDDGLLSVQYDHYTITWEKRTPAEFESNRKNWDNLINSLKVNSAWQAVNGRSANLYLDNYLMATLTSEEVLLSGKIRAEVGARTGAGEVRFGVHLEHLGDSGIPVQPKASTLLGIGVRIMSPGSVM